MYSCNYPIWHTLTSTNDYVDYDILLNGNEIYTGRVYFRSESERSLSIDISGICREYLETFYENIERASQTSTAAVPQVENFATIGEFVVKADDSSETYVVKYDYNTDYMSELPDSGSLNDPITGEVDPRQMVYLTGYSYRGTTNFSYSIEEGSSGTGSLSSTFFALHQLNLDGLEAPIGSTLTAICNGIPHTYKIVPPCRNRFVLYYVNKYGGLDSLLCGGKAVESFNAERTDISLYKDKSNRMEGGEKRIYQQVEKQYQLNTRWLTEEGAAKIDNLIYSPKVWIHDLASDTITSCLVTDSSYTVKTIRNDKIISYAINVAENHKHIRK